MIRLTSTDLFNEIQDAEKLRDQYLECVREITLAWVGRHYRKDWPGKVTLENYTHLFLRNVLPQLVFSTPSVTVSPDVDASDTATAEGMEGVINHWTKATGYKRTLKRMARDLCLSWGVTKTFYRASGGGVISNRGREGAELLADEARPALPVVDYLDPADHFVDAHCLGYEKRRLEGDRFDRDLEDLLADPLYADYADVIEKLQPNSQWRRRAGDPGPEHRENLADRKRVTLYELWLPEHGMIVTLAQQGEGKGTKIREEEYVGPSEGPYSMHGVFEVRNQVYPLSPITATYEQQSDTNIYARQAQRDARNWKRIAVYQVGEKDGATIQAAKHASMVGVNDPKSVQEIEIGGVSTQQAQVLDSLKERAERHIIGESQQGNASSGTATADMNAQQATDFAVDWIRQALIEGAEADLRKVGWFFWNQSELIIKTTVLNRTSGERESLEFYGGPFEPEFLQEYGGGPGMNEPGAFAAQIGSDWVDYHLSISVDSLVRVADPIRQKRAQDEVALCERMAAAGMPINWRRVLDRYGEAFNEKSLSQIILLDQDMMMVPPDPLAVGNQMPGAQAGIGAAGGGPSLPAPGGFGGPPRSAAPSTPSGPATLPGLMRSAKAGVSPLAA